MADLRMDDDSDNLNHLEAPGRFGRHFIEISDSDDDEGFINTLRRPAMARHPATPPENRRRNAVGSSSNPQTLSDSDDPFLNDIYRHAERDTKRVKREHQSSMASAARDNQQHPLRPQRQDNEHVRPRATQADQPNHHVPGFSDLDEQNVTAIRQLLDNDDASNIGVDSQNQPRKPDIDQERQPWYFDVKFDIDMYQGPGYERFPVALGTVQGHQEICDDFKRRRQAMREGQRAANSASTLTFGERALKQVLEMFPDISHAFVNRQTELIVQQNPQLSPDQLPLEAVLENILELDEYPKEPRKKEQKETAAADGTGFTVPVKIPARNDGSYLTDAVILLAWQFPHVPTCYIVKVMREKRAIYDTYIHLYKAENTFFKLQTSNRPYRRARQARQSIEKKYSRPLGPYYGRSIDYGHWVNEIQAAKQHIERETIRTNRKEEEATREANNFDEHRRRGLLIECQVCFDDEIPINRAVSCEGLEGHLFCHSCVTQLAETQVGQMKYEMKCMHVDGCTADLDAEGIGKAVSIKTVDRLAFNQQQADIKAAGIEGLEECPVCDFKAILDPVEEAIVFNCMNPDCGRASCRKCKGEAHVPLSCEEFKNDRGLEARHAVEEARTESVLRPCPKCKVKIIKEIGCNKMTCTQCGCLMCYLCKEDISKNGYGHFNLPDATCVLYDNNPAARHDAEAHAAELEAIKKAKAQNADLDEKKLRIETGKPKKAPLTAPNPPGHFAYHPHLGPLGVHAGDNFRPMAFGDAQQHNPGNPQQAQQAARAQHVPGNQNQYQPDLDQEMRELFDQIADPQLPELPPLPQVYGIGHQYAVPPQDRQAYPAELAPRQDQALRGADQQNPPPIHRPDFFPFGGIGNDLGFNPLALGPPGVGIRFQDWLRYVYRDV